MYPEEEISGSILSSIRGVRPSDVLSFNEIKIFLHFIEYDDPLYIKDRGFIDKISSTVRSGIPVYKTQDLKSGVISSFEFSYSISEFSDLNAH